MNSTRGTEIDGRAVVDSGAELDHGVVVGPFAVVGPDVRIGRGTEIGPHAVVEGRTTLGAGNRVFQFASVGTEPQDLKYAGEDSELIIGDGNLIRECVTIHRGTEGGGMVTRIGDGNLFMAYSHVAHDCAIGSGVVMANAATLGGHVEVHDGAILGGLAGVHQFCRVGSLAMVAAGSLVVKDVAPYTSVQGDRARLVGLNMEGLRRRCFEAGTVKALKSAYRMIFRSGIGLGDALAAVRNELLGSEEVEYFLRFIEESKRGVVK